VSSKVSEVEARSALIQLTPPQVSGVSDQLDVDSSEFLYELQLSERKDTNYTVMYRYGQTDINRYWQTDMFRYRQS